MKKLISVTNGISPTEENASALDVGLSFAPHLESALEVGIKLSLIVE